MLEINNDKIAEIKKLFKVFFLIILSEIKKNFWYIFSFQIILIKYKNINFTYVYFYFFIL